MMDKDIYKMMKTLKNKKILSLIVFPSIKKLVKAEDKPIWERKNDKPTKPKA